MRDPATSPRSPLRLILAAGIVLTGAVWVLQGLGILTAARSFMVGDPAWVAIGAVMVVIGILLGWRTARR